MFLETLAPDTSALLKKLSGQSWLKKYYLAGGTALALQYGHRQSVDLDFFTLSKINPSVIAKKLSNVGKLTITNQEENTLEGILEGVKVSFMTFPYPLVEKTILFEKNIVLASPLDIALMKLNAVAGRNAKKDFIDLYLFLEKNKLTIKKLVGRLDEKYDVSLDYYHFYKALTYFKEADDQPMPKMLIQISWLQVKKYFTNQIKNI